MKTPDVIQVLSHLWTKLSAKWKQQHYQPDPAKNGTQPSGEHQQSGTSNQTEISGWHPDEQHHRSKEQRYWRMSLFISLLVAVGAGGSVMFAWQAVSEARKQAKAANSQLLVMLDQQRPWVSIEPGNASDIQFKNGNAFFQFIFNIKNVGHEPALRVKTSVVAEALKMGVMGAPNIDLEALCAETERSLTFTTLFPDQVAVSISDLIISGDKIKEANSAQGSSKTAYIPVINICVTYEKTFRGTKVKPATATSYFLSTPRDGPMMGLTIGTRTQSADIRATPNYYGAGIVQ